MLDQSKINELEKKAKEIRASIIKMLAEAGSGHTAGPLAMADIFSALYFNILKHNPNKPNWPERDRVVLSNGHICPVMYATMAHSGYFSINELKTLRKFGSKLQGHPHREFLNQLETSSGPLGSGLSQSIGMALSDKMDRKMGSKYFYCLMSDGEFDEGETWEAIMLASKEKLFNLIAIIDRNKIQLSGDTEKIMPLEPFKVKIESFGWMVSEIDGHHFDEIVSAVDKAKSHREKPVMIIANTVASKGVPEWEGKWQWHGKVPSKEEAEIVLEKYFK